VREALGLEFVATDQDLVDAVKRMKEGGPAQLEPTNAMVQAFRKDFHECQNTDMSHTAAIRRSLAAALRAAVEQKPTAVQ
jgi:hypothetical protein